jgi:preprotein translocase subunit SecF
MKDGTKMNNMKLRFFAVGILFVTVVLFIYVQFFNKAEQEDVKKTLKKDGYALVTMDEFEELKNKVEMLEKGQLNEEQQKASENGNNVKEQQKENEKSNEEQQKEKQQSDEQKKDEQQEPKKVVIKIETGMSLSDIADRLLENKIIKDKKAFVDFMVNNDYERYVQIGDFEFKQGMNLKEVADVITR